MHGEHADKERNKKQRKKENKLIFITEGIRERLETN